MLDKIIFLSFAALFTIVPLFWTPFNFELFEFNKMMLTYGLTMIIVGSWLLKMINSKSLIFNRTPLDIPLILFLGANILSTVFSIDQHTSIWGYYSRSNGGLLSLITYLLLYWAFVSNIQKKEVFKLLKYALLAGFIISVWAILEHFGVSPSCVILRGELNASCWVQDVQARVFATIGQPNWLAAYLAMLIFPALYFFLTAKTQKQLITYFLSLITLYMAFTFTYSRGGTLGLLAGIGTLAAVLLFERMRKHTSLKPVLIILFSFFLINILFGSALTRFQLSNLFSTSNIQSLDFARDRPPTSNIQIPPSTSQLEAGGSESGQIRLIVWQGALDIFKNYPLFGSGVETFAYSYYQFRPVAHNLTSEWDFLYNKAHNEFLNYLATTGLVGFASYIIIIITFIIFILKRLEHPNSLLLTTLLAAYVSYLVQNFFSFSVVIIALFFYLFPSIAFVITDSPKPLKLPRFITHDSLLITFIYRRPLYTKAAQGVIILVTCYLLFMTIRFWYADRLFALGQQASEQNNVGRGYNYLTQAVNLRPSEPFYRNELGYVAAAAALALKDSDATLSAELKDEAINETENSLTKNPKNNSFLRNSIKTYFELYGLDESFLQKTLEVTDKTIVLAPTDAKLYYNKAIILGSVNRNKEAITELIQATSLKPNYKEAYFTLGLFYFDEGEKSKALEAMKKVLQIDPKDADALKKLEEWK